MIERAYTTTLRHDELDMWLDVTVLPVPEVSGKSTMNKLAEAMLGTGASGSVIVDRDPGTGLTGLLVDLMKMLGAHDGEAEEQRIRSFAEYVAMAPVVPVENSWPSMTSLWSLIAAVGGGAATGAEYGLMFSPGGAAVGAVVGAGSVVVVRAAKGAGEGLEQLVKGPIVRTDQRARMQSKLDDLNRMVQEQRITRDEAAPARQIVLEEFGRGS